MKSMNAVKFRLLLSILLFIAVALICAAFIFGYQHLQSVGEDTRRRQADATASEDSIGNLQRLQVQLSKLDGLTEQLSTLKSSSSLPQFDTERSLRTIASQLGIGIKNIVFIEDAPAAPAQGTTGTTTTPQATAPATTAKNSKISFEFDGPISYNNLIRFLDAVETSTPKLTLKGIAIPAESTRESIESGVLTLELATV